MFLLFFGEFCLVPTGHCAFFRFLAIWLIATNTNGEKNQSELRAKTQFALSPDQMLQEAIMTVDDSSCLNGIASLNYHQLSRAIIHFEHVQNFYESDQTVMLPPQVAVHVALSKWTKMASKGQLFLSRFENKENFGKQSGLFVVQ